MLVLTVNGVQLSTIPSNIIYYTERKEERFQISHCELHLSRAILQLHLHIEYIIVFLSDDTIFMVSVLASSAVERGFEPWSGQTKDYEICICCFRVKHAALRRKNKDWLAGNVGRLFYNNTVSDWCLIQHQPFFSYIMTRS
jgi:hypothetical protein